MTASSERMCAFLIILASCYYTYIAGKNVFKRDMTEMGPTHLTTSSEGLSFNKRITNQRWWGGGIVPYQISTAFTSDERILIMKAMKGFHNISCVRFLERTDEEDFIFLYPGDGCWSFVGRQQQNNSLISLSQSGCMTIGIIQHQLMHALGFHHEQSRADRDDFVDIFWDNIEKGRRNYNFLKYLDTEINELSLPYDFESIVHFGTNDFAKDPSKPTIAPKPQYQPRQSGQSQRLSPIDIQKINLKYNCSAPARI